MEHLKIYYPDCVLSEDWRAAEENHCIEKCFKFLHLGVCSLFAWHREGSNLVKSSPYNRFVLIENVSEENEPQALVQVALLALRQGIKTLVKVSFYRLVGG